jgi:hypothetical protein
MAEYWGTPPRPCPIYTGSTSTVITASGSRDSNYREWLARPFDEHQWPPTTSGNWLSCEEAVTTTTNSQLTYPVPTHRARPVGHL